jgi:flagellar basal body-associated protein FliL
MNKRKIYIAESGHILLYSVLVVAIVGVGGLGAWKIHEHDKASTTAKATTAIPTTPTYQAVTAPLPTGTDNASLQNDLSNVNSSFNQQTSDQTTVNGAVNDQQNEITVPTN